MERFGLGSSGEKPITSELPVIRNERQAHNGIEGPALPSPTQRIMVGPSRSIQLLRLISLWLQLQPCRGPSQRARLPQFEA